MSGEIFNGLGKDHAYAFAPSLLLPATSRTSSLNLGTGQKSVMGGQES